MLAAYDIAQAAAKEGLDIRLACYTFGAPRVGNHNFAADHEQVVPDAWSIINDQVWNLPRPVVLFLALLMVSPGPGAMS